MSPRRRLLFNLWRLPLPVVTPQKATVTVHPTIALAITLATVLVALPMTAVTKNQTPAPVAHLTDALAVQAQATVRQATVRRLRVGVAHKSKDTACTILQSQAALALHTDLALRQVLQNQKTVEIPLPLMVAPPMVLPMALINRKNRPTCSPLRLLTRCTRWLGAGFKTRKVVSTKELFVFKKSLQILIKIGAML